MQRVCLEGQHESIVIRQLLPMRCEYQLKIGKSAAQWICALRENQYFDDAVEKPTVTPNPSK
jgi:hypothetical protein